MSNLHRMRIPGGPGRPPSSRKTRSSERETHLLPPDVPEGAELPRSSVKIDAGYPRIAGDRGTRVPVLSPEYSPLHSPRRLSSHCRAAPTLPARDFHQSISISSMPNGGVSTLHRSDSEGCGTDIQYRWTSRLKEIESSSSSNERPSDPEQSLVRGAKRVESPHRQIEGLRRVASVEP